jgi:hypothetical protein
MKYNIGDLFVCTPEYKHRSIIGIITEYDDKHDLYTIEWMNRLGRWSSYTIPDEIHDSIKKKIYEHYSVNNDEK